VEKVKAMLDKGEPYMLIDARPANKFLEGAIPSAVSIPTRLAEERAGMLPADKSVPLIFYCGGFT
jgi:rhodanese-related sulfurtransferase